MVTQELGPKNQLTRNQKNKKELRKSKLTESEPTIMELSGSDLESLHVPYGYVGW